MRRNIDMSPNHLYQPVLLRILHGIAAALLVLALISGFLIYNTYDKRWGNLALPRIGDIQGIHGTIALAFLLFLPVFALYSFHIGYRRLVQEQSFSQLKQLGNPVWWISVHRFANTLMLLAATFAVVTGRMMKEEWLPAGEIQRQWYLAHLVAWVCVFVSLALHLLMGAKVGGLPLLLSMFNWTMRSEDTRFSWLQEVKINHSSLVLKVLEVIVIGGIIMAFLLPVFNS
ncbi:cytochrome b/b6 domain-containing protein [Chamaesiphon sp. OTE_75_metabat_556]|uniref:cytochrome b/b6 domain-containing protein n=1 Tax=Chamaesiphon sp. OTE_75_metabat_556 TaxID=2964692 RepID=UPI00286A1F9C|nr:cytochrome b/b6 domain-containing protein [Chamaesiphon sp. OTE_75_metabat_556]